jgi:LysR family glycine cleavage system transcriptional activator
LRAHPQIEVRVAAETGRAGFSWDAIDLAILYRQETAAEKHSVPLLEELVQPICSPRILHEKPIRRPADILQHVLIHTSYNSVTWKDWFNAHAVGSYGLHQRIQIDPSHVAIEAAAKDFGVVLESDILARDEISAGHLVVPLPECAIRRKSYVLTWSPEKKIQRSAALLRDWLLAEAQRLRIGE